MSSDSRCGEVPEWSNGTVSKTVEGASLPRVRIPVSPNTYWIWSVPVRQEKIRVAVVDDEEGKALILIAIVGAG